MHFVTDIGQKATSCSEEAFSSVVGFHERQLTVLNETVGFKIPTRAIAIICAAHYTVVPQTWTSGVGWSSGPLGVARGIKGSGTDLTLTHYSYFQN